MKIPNLYIAQRLGNLMKKIPFYNNALAWMKSHPKSVAFGMFGVLCIWAVYSISMTIHLQNKKMDIDNIIKLDKINTFKTDQFSLEQYIMLQSLQEEIERIKLDTAQLDTAKLLKIKRLIKEL